MEKSVKPKKYLAFLLLAVTTIACTLSSKTPSNRLVMDTNKPTQVDPTQTTVPTQTKPVSSPTPTQTSIPPTTTPSGSNSTWLPATIPNNCIPAQQPQLATVTGITDGDTITVRIDGVEFPLRYIGIDTPETHFGTEKLGPEAADRNQKLVLFKQVELYRDVSETDQYDRLLRYVVADGIFINEALVSEGFASAADYPPDTACSALFHKAEQDARSNNLGLWFALPAANNANTNAMTISIISVDKKKEVVVLQNKGNASIDLGGWVLVSERGSQSCSLSGMLSPGSTLQIWAQNGPGFSCGFSSPIWNNSQSDPAVLYNSGRLEVSRYP